MALKMILNKQTDFTGEFPAEYAASGLWIKYHLPLDSEKDGVTVLSKIKLPEEL